jgi:tetratricopeptide (TPR) repeat protein
VHLQPRTKASSRSNHPTRFRVAPFLIVRLEALKVALAVAFVALASGASAQVYNIGPDSPKTPQAQSNQKHPADQTLGWGSNIQNARLARAAELALQHGDHAQALDFAQRAAQATPNDPHLWFLLGYAARLNGKLQVSVDAYARGLRLSPSAVDGLSGLAQTYSMIGRTDDAIRLLKEAVASDPRRRADALLLGDLYLRSADYTDAVEWLSRAERIQPDARSELLMALSYQHLKQMDIASHYLDMAKRRSPDNPDVERTMAGYYRESGKYSEAIAALKSIRNPRPDVTAELAFTYQLDGNLGDSAKLYAQAANAGPKDLSLQLSAAQAEVAVGSIEKANSFIARAAALDANHYRLHAIEGEIARLQEREQDAVKEYKAALANLPASPAEGLLYGIQLHMDLMETYRVLADDTAAHHELDIAQKEIGAQGDQGAGRAQFLHLRSLIKMNTGDLDGALIDITGALAVNTHDRNDLQLDGDVLMKLGRTEDAIAAYKQILVVDTANRYALTSLGYASRAAGRDQDAERYFQRLTEADPSLFISYLALGDLYTARREFEKAQESYGNAYTRAPSKAMIIAGGMNAAIEAHNLSLGAKWLSRGTNEMSREPQILREKERYLRLVGQYQESSEVGREAIRVLPRDRDVVVYLGYDLLYMGKYDELQTLTSQYLEVFPNDADIPLLEGYVHKHGGLLEDARQDFTKALKRDPDMVTGYVNRGYILNDLNQPEASAADFESALAREPDNGEAHLGLAFASLDLNKPEAALQQTELAERTLGDSRDLHVIRATAYGREKMAEKADNEYRAALKFTPNDGALHLGLGNSYFAERRYHDAIGELQIAEKLSPDDASVYALLARSYANLQDREQSLRYVQLAEQRAEMGPASARGAEAAQSEVLLSSGEALNTLGDQKAAMDLFRRALALRKSNRVSVRLSIAEVMAQQGRVEDAERQIALALMEGQAGETAPTTGSQFIAAADVLRVMHDYQLSQTYLRRAKAAGAPDEEVRIGLANNYLALGDTVRAEAELSAVRTSAESGPGYQYLLAEANVQRQEHHGAEALTSFARASNAEGEDQAAEQDLLQAGADEGLRITPVVSVLSDFSVAPIFEDSTVYVLDSKTDAAFSVPSSASALLPPPRSSLETQETAAYHLHLEHLPTASGSFQVRNSRGQISVPSTNSIVSRNTTDYAMSVGLNPTVRLGTNVLTFNSGVRGTLRRDSDSPVEMNQNLFRAFTYMSTSSFFNTVSLKGYVIWEAGPFTESSLHSRSLSGAIDFRVGAPWGKTALVTGWGAADQKFSPVNFEDHYTSSYLGLEHRFGERIKLKAVVEDVRAWRVVGTTSGIAQNLRPAGGVDWFLNHSWDIKASTAYSSTRSFHVYDATQNGFSISYARPFRRKFNDESGAIVLQYPIRVSAGFQQETFFNFKGGQSQQFKPYVRISLF